MFLSYTPGILQFVMRTLIQRKITVTLTMKVATVGQEGMVEN